MFWYALSTMKDMKLMLLMAALLLAALHPVYCLSRGHAGPQRGRASRSMVRGG